MNALACLRKIMDARGLSLYYIAKQSGIPYSTMKSHFQRGSQLSLQEIQLICTALDISLQQFLGGLAATA